MRSMRLLLIIALLTTIFGCQTGNGYTVPDPLLGVWKTSHSKYADRFFEIKKDLIIFGQGEGKSEFHAIVDVEESRAGKNTFLYTITHVNEYGQRYIFSFYYYYYPDDGGAIRFTHQKDIVWTKESP